MSRRSAPRRASRPITVVGHLPDRQHALRQQLSSSCRWTRRRLIFNTGDTVTGIEVMVQIPTTTSPCCPRWPRRPGRRHVLVPWQDINSAFFEAVQVESNVMFLILTLIILVAALNIVSGLIMLVKDKSRRHRHPAHHGRDARRGDAGVPDRGHEHRRHRHAAGLLPSACCSAEYRDHPPGPVAG